MKLIVMALVQIEFECKNNCHIKDFDEALNSAIHLAINPNYHTIEEGVSLINVTATSNQQTFNFSKQ